MTRTIHDGPFYLRCRRRRAAGALFIFDDGWFILCCLLLLLLLFVEEKGGVPVVQAAPAIQGLSDPDRQPKFQTMVPNPLAPYYIFDTSSSYIEISIGHGYTSVGLVGPDGTSSVWTPIWGYGTTVDGYTWPGRTMQVRSYQPLNVKWTNRLPIAPGYLLTGVGKYNGRSVVDTSFHYCYTIPGYRNYTIETHGTPIVPHLHGGHSDPTADGHSESFFTPDYAITGPQWHGEVNQYDNSQPATALWYHDHALGLTRLNVHAGLAGFYIVRDDMDTGRPDNPLRLPAYPYELPLMIQDRMFKETGELFYPAFPGDPYYADFITDQGAQLPDPDAPTALAEFFGDHMVVNGKIWPRTEVEPRQYRLRLLNACDSRFLVLKFVVQQGGGGLGGDEEASNDEEPRWPLAFYVIGGDQGLASTVRAMNKVVLLPAGRLDIVIDFKQYAGQQIVLMNEGGDEPFGGEIPGPQIFAHTDRIMRFDVSLPLDAAVPDDYQRATVPATPIVDPVKRVRRLGLFEGKDQYGRLQPLLGTLDPATDRNFQPIYYPDTAIYAANGLTSSSQMVGTMTWNAPATENMNLNDVEEWEIWNLSADAHPIHLHLVRMEYVSRRGIQFDSAADEDGILASGHVARGDGTYIQEQVLVQQDGTVGTGFRVYYPTDDSYGPLGPLPYYAYHYPMDVVVALPGEITTIRAKFDKLGGYSWHCHIIAHEDHEMMRRFHVGELPSGPPLVVANPYVPRQRPEVVLRKAGTSTATRCCRGLGGWPPGTPSSWRMTVYLLVVAWVAYWYI